MVKKIFTIILIGCFLSFAITPVCAGIQEELEEIETRQERRVFITCGLIVLLWAIVTLKNRPKRRGFRFVFSSELESNFSAAEIPIMGITYTW